MVVMFVGCRDLEQLGSIFHQDSLQHTRGFQRFGVAVNSDEVGGQEIATLSNVIGAGGPVAAKRVSITRSRLRVMRSPRFLSRSETVCIVRTVSFRGGMSTP